MPTSVSSQATEGPRSILILNQAYSGSLAYTQIEDGIRQAVDPSALIIYREFLDLNYFRDAGYRRLLESFLREKYRDIPIEVIVSVGPEPLQFAFGLRGRDHSKISIIFAAVPDRANQLSMLPAGVTGRTVEVSLASFVRAANTLVPGLKRVALVGDPLETQAFRSHFKHEVSQIAADLDLIDLTGLPMRLLKKRVAELPNDSAILFTTINIDGDGVRFLPRESLKIIADVANRPIVVDVGSFLGTGAVGGFAIKPLLIGQETGQLVKRILDGEDISQISIAPSHAWGPIFDWNALQKWNVSEANLPPGSEILFRESSAWTRYRLQIVLTVLALLVQSALIAALLLEDRARRAAQSQSFQLINELARRERVSAVGEMSATLAHELSQPLAAIVAYGTAGLRWLSNKTPDLDEAKKALQTIVEQAHRAGDVIKSVRALVTDDSAPKARVNVDSLVHKVLGLVEIEIQKKRVRLVLEAAGNRNIEVNGSEVQLQQVLLNVVMNAIEAMGSTTDRERLLRLTLRSSKDGDVSIAVEDSGPGIDPSNVDKIFNPFFTTKTRGVGLGLSICRSIVQAHGGKLTVANGNSKGAIVQIAIPQCREGVG